MEAISLSPRTRFGVDFLWNIGSLAVLGVSGIVVNLLIARWGGATDLGVFNQVFAFFLFLSQICVGGIHYSVLKELSDTARDKAELSDIATAAVVLSGGLATVVVVCCLPLTEGVGRLFESPAVARGLALALPGVVFFSINKVLLNVLNGLRHMRAHAIFQALRYLLLVGSISAVFLLDLDRVWLCGALTLTELILLCLLLPYLHLRTVPLFTGLRRRGARVRGWMGTHLWFGARGMWSGVCTELNTRIDVLVLGFFFDDSKVGIYSFAAAFAEGFAQIPLVLRRNLDPLFGEYLARGMFTEIKALVRRTRRLFFPLMLVLGLVSTVVYGVCLPILVADPSYWESIWVYGILAAAITLTAWFRPFGGLLLQGGLPGTYTVMTLASLAVNGMVAMALAPSLGLIGCALGAAASLGVEAWLLVVLTQRRLSIRV